MGGGDSPGGYGNEDNYGAFALPRRSSLIPGITGPHVGVGSATAASAVSRASAQHVDQSVSVDLRGSQFMGGVTDQMVTQIFNKGIDKAKRGGAFRPGVWPR